DEVIAITDPAEREAAIASLRELKDKIVERESAYKKVVERWQELMYEAPNIPDPSVPDGATDADNIEVRRIGTPRNFDFKIKSHIELARDLDLADFERGAKVSGFRGYFLKNEAALLSLALWQFTVDTVRKLGYHPFMAPALVREENLFGTGHFPQAREDVFKTQDDLYLAGTAEIPITGYFAGELMSENDLPKKYVAFSPCFRREAGAYGRDTKGIYRVHEFFKVEQFILGPSDHRQSVEFHEELTGNAESILQTLGLPYRVVILCGGDLGRAHVKTYDIETWIPSEGRYRESHSASYYHDFQARRFNIRYKDASGKINFCHTLNNTAIATPRILISILENYQNPDGSVTIPDALRKYIGKEKIEKTK
ncbi:MAG: serine--tRNA ligase, partial [Patescibacteria group bacterium]